MKEQPTIEESATARLYQFKNLGIQVSYDLNRDEFTTLTIYGKEVNGFKPCSGHLWAGPKFTDNRNHIRDKFSRLLIGSGEDPASATEWDLYRFGRYEKKYHFDKTRRQRLAFEATTQVQEGWRAPNATEVGVLNELLAVNFPGASELRQQLKGLKVLEIDAQRSLVLRVKNQVPASVIYVVPVEATYSDVGNLDPHSPRVNALLHVQGNLLDELEFYKDDGTEIVRWPDPEELEIEIRRPEDDHQFALLGASTTSENWKRYMKRALNEKPEIEKFPRGIRIFSFPKSGVQAFFKQFKLYSIAFYGPGAHEKFSAYTGRLPGQLQFGSRLDEVRSKFGQPVLIIEHKPTRPTELNMSNEERLRETDELTATTRREFYKVGTKYCVVIEFDEAKNDSLLNIELEEYEGVMKAFNLE